MLDAILRQRFHGAVNIRGIRYQLLYSLFRALDLYSNSGVLHSVRFEGIEDLDLLGLHIEADYIQIKTSQTSWSWSKLGGPIENFVEVLRIAPNSSFVLAVNFPLTNDLARLAELTTLSPKEYKRLANKFKNLCMRNKATESEADALLKRLTITSISEERVQKGIQQTLTNIYNLNSIAVDVYMSVFVAHCLEWAHQRKEVTTVELNTVRDIVASALAREAEFDAYGRGLICKIDWTLDKSVNDFYEGKDTRPGHIVADIDIIRPFWMQKIDQGINSARVCIIRSSSGQGKSTLLYRYAHNYWPTVHTLVLRVAESPEQVEMIRHYLRFRSDVGLPTFLLIDGANWSTRLWSSIVQECISLGIPALVAVRQEDWSRFARRSLTGYEIVEPYLDIEEAKGIHNLLQGAKKVHSSVVSPEWAYERIGSPKLLMEYVYLLTHGQILEERLRDQIQQFGELNEDPGKLEILRRISLADVLGVPVKAELLVKDISLIGDAQQILASLAGEYIRIENKQLNGYHRVRSEHLAQILHEGYPSLTETAIAIFPAVPSQNISIFIANALMSPGIDSEKLMSELVRLEKFVEIRTVLAVLDGLFEAGERGFFIQNLKLFDEAYELAGSSGPRILSSEVLPIVRVDFLKGISEILKDERGDNFRHLLIMLGKIDIVPRGIDLCRLFLTRVTLQFETRLVDGKLKEIGEFLDWYSLCNLEISIRESVKKYIFMVRITADQVIDDFAAFTQGLFRFDEELYKEWFSQNRYNIIGFLKLELTCVAIEINNNEVLIKYMPELAGDTSIHDQMMTRFNLLRSILPFCEVYRSQPIWNLPFGLLPSVDDATKELNRTDLHFKSDIEKNVVWTRIVEAKYSSDSYYNYQEYWYGLRKNAVTFAQQFSNGLIQNLRGEPLPIQPFSILSHPHSISDSIQHAPSLPFQTNKEFAEVHNQISTKWLSNFYTFIRQISKYSEDIKNKREGQLALHNLGEVTTGLQQLHSSFAMLFEQVTDYFSAIDIDKTETSAFELLKDILEAVVLEPYIIRQEDPLLYIRERQEKIQREKLQQVYRAVEDLNETGVTISVPTAIYKDYPLLYLPLAFAVDNPCYPEIELAQVVNALEQVRDTVHFWYLIPLYNGTRFIEGAYQLSSSTIQELVAGQKPKMWETLIPQQIPKDILELLPMMPLQKVTMVEARIKLLELVSNLDVYYRAQSMFSELPTQTEWERKLSTKYQDRLIQIRQQICAASDAGLLLVAQLVEEYPESANNHYMEVFEIVRLIQKACDENILDDLMNKLDLEDFIRTIEKWMYKI